MLKFVGKVRCALFDIRVITSIMFMASGAHVMDK